jgi:putative NADH-flavin reductase
MHIALFGATGGTGRQIVQQALATGHHITALVRDPAKLAPTPAGLSLIQGDVQESARVEQTLQGADVVVITLGNTANNPDKIVSLGTRHILDAMQTHGPQRLLVITSLGVGDSKDQVPFVFRMLMRTLLAKAMADKEEQEQLVRASSLDWTIIRPGGLTDGPATGDYRVGPKLTAAQVSRADVAAFVLTQLTDRQYLHQAIAIT